MTQPAFDSYRRLAEIFHDVLAEEALDALLERVADALSDLIPYDTLTIYRADDARNVLVPQYARDKWATEILDTTIPYGVGITGAAVVQREPVFVRQVQLDPRSTPIPGTPLEAEALVSVPLIARGRLKGALNVYRLGEDASFLAEEVELVGCYGDAVALALDNAEVRARLEHQARTDSLTGLYNHRQFHERLRAEVARAVRSGEPLSVLMLDVDDFKRINDVYGHATGDRALVQIADLLSATVRVSDVVCRIGGEEFGVILPQCDEACALGLAERVRTLLGERAFDTVGPLSVCIGIAHAPEHAMNPRELSACAETAMMIAKAKGKDRVFVFGRAEGSRPEIPLHDDRDARSIAHLKMLQSLVGRLNQLNDVTGIGETIISELRSLVDYHSGRVYLLEDDELVPIAFRGEPGVDDGVTAEMLVCALGEGVTGHVAETGRSALVPNALECDFAVQIPGTPPIEESVVAVPLCFSGRVTGVILISKLGVDQFDDADVRLLEVLAGHASVALENARLYEAARREATRAHESAEIARSLLALSRELAEADGIDDVVRRVASSSETILGAPRASVWLQTERGGPLELGAQAGFDDATELLLRLRRIDGRAARVVLDRDLPIVLDGPELTALAPALYEPGARYAFSPLRLDAGRIGIVAAGWLGDTSTEPSGRTLRLLAGIADQAMLALGSAASFASLEQTFLSTVEALANALETNDDAPSQARSLTDRALRVGAELGLDASALKRLELGALFHDIGKIGIPSEVLGKTGPLTPLERAAVEMHPTLGERILHPIEPLAEIRPIVRHCFERYNGTGYPDGIAGDEIPLESRIIFVCDSFQAMTNDRPYRRRLTREEAFRRLEEAAGTQFDPEVVATFVRIFAAERVELRAS